jgi:hypothetical protein
MGAVLDPMVRWWKRIWKVKVPKKKKIMWLVLQDKVLTWKDLQKRNIDRPSFCVLCRRAEETSYHLFLECVFVKHVRWDVRKWLGEVSLWNKEDVGLCLQGWFTKPKLNIYRVIPFLVLWGIWLSRNNRLFAKKEIPTFQVFSQVVVIYNQVKKSSTPNLPQQIG